MINPNQMKAEQKCPTCNKPYFNTFKSTDATYCTCYSVAGTSTTPMNLEEEANKEFYEFIDEITSETGYNFDKVYKAFAYTAAKHFYKQQFKKDIESLDEKTIEEICRGSTDPTRGLYQAMAFANRITGMKLAKEYYLKQLK